MKTRTVTRTRSLRGRDKVNGCQVGLAAAEEEEEEEFIRIQWILYILTNGDSDLITIGCKRLRPGDLEGRRRRRRGFY